MMMDKTWYRTPVVRSGYGIMLLLFGAMLVFGGCADGDKVFMNLPSGL